MWVVFYVKHHRLLLCTSGDCVKVYSTSTEECIHNLQGHTDLVTGVLIKPSNHLQVRHSTLLLGLVKKPKFVRQLPTFDVGVSILLNWRFFGFIRRHCIQTKKKQLSSVDDNAVKASLYWRWDNGCWSFSWSIKSCVNVFAIGETSTVYTFKGPVCKSCLAAPFFFFKEAHLTYIQIASSGRLSLKLTTLDLKSRHFLSSSSGCPWYPQWWHCRYLPLFKCITSQIFNSSLISVICVFFFFFFVAAGLFLLNRRHRQAMGLHRRHTHQGTAPPSWPVRYLSVQPAALGPFWVFFSARSRCFLSDLHRRTACLRHVRVRAPLGRHFPHHSPCRGQKIR